jgi:hypothetical protein
MDGKKNKNKYFIFKRKQTHKDFTTGLSRNIPMSEQTIVYVANFYAQGCEKR